MSTLDRAIQIATTAHKGQVDRAGCQYILHPLRVMEAMDTDEEKIVAVLHDVIEDTNVTIPDLIREQFAPAVILSLIALTKSPGESKMDAAKRAKKDPTARKVKLADNADNMDLSRLPSITDADLKRNIQYQAVRDYLLDISE